MTRCTAYEVRILAIVALAIAAIIAWALITDPTEPHADRADCAPIPVLCGGSDDR